MLRNRKELYFCKLGRVNVKSLWNAVFEYTTCVNVHSSAETAELELSREKKHVLQEWVMLYLWETFYLLWVLKTAYHAQ